jgi:phosphoglycolate phosphatase
MTDAGNRYRLVVFDWDGTLMDSVGHIVHSIRAAAADLQVEAPEDGAIRDIIGLGLREAVERLFPGRDELFLIRLVDSYRRHYLPPGGSPTRLFAGVEEVIRSLHQQGYLLAVATGKGRGGLDHVLEETRLGPLFHATRCADETRSKPDPQMLVEILQQLGVGPGECVMVGDTVWDLEMARRAAVDRIGVSYGVHSCRQLATHQPLACIDRIQDLPALL